MKHWDYTVRIYGVHRDQLREVENDLQRMGVEGWELVSLLPVADSTIQRGNTSHVVGAFKRPRAASDDAPTR